MYVIFYNNKPIYLTDNQVNFKEDKYYDIDKKPLLELIKDIDNGKVEKGESVEKAALREVEEECGVSDLKLENFIDKTYHIYEYKSKLIFKITHWFKMASNQNTALVPQLEEGITKAVFLDKQAQKEALKNTYPNIKLLLENLK